MKMIKREVFESLKRRKRVALLISMGLLLFFFAMTALFLHFTQVETQGEQVESFRGLISYELSETLYDNKDWRAFSKEPRALERVKEYYHYLEKELDEKYYYIFSQPIKLVMDGKPLNKVFLDGYEDGIAEKRVEHAFFKGEDGPYYTFKAVQLNEQAYNAFPLEVSEGQSFSDKDFHHRTNPGVIPVLLGAEYKDDYVLGETIKAHYLNKDFTLEIKGFLSPASFVLNANQPEIYLDRYVVMPAQQFEQPADEEEWEFQWKHYFQLINGSIYSKKTQSEIEEKVEKAKTSADFPHSQIIGVPNTPMDKLFAAIQEQIRLVMILAVALFVGCVLSLTILMMTKIQDNYKNLSIHLISGATMNQLFRYVLAEVILLVSLPGVVMIFLYGATFFSLPSLYLYVITSCALLIAVLTVIPIYLQFRRLPISRLLKRAE